jgi:KaiC/GvpD/RAD55 family RecA-like ATPase
MSEMDNKKSYIKQINDAIEEFRKTGLILFIYGGIKKGSFGYVFGPSKSGKTTICENLALSLVCGKTEFLGKPILNMENGYRVLFISFEEHFHSRTERNDKQVQYINPKPERIDLFVVDDDFPKFLQSIEDWQKFKDVIAESKAEVVFIDSFNRICCGDIERGNIAKNISAELKKIAYECDITMIVIHHTPKLYGNILTIDSLAGSHVIAQEADFLIGINRVNGVRYIKEVSCRYKREDDEKVLTFEINDHLWIVPGKTVVESTLFKELDGRVDDTNLDFVRTLIKSATVTKGSIDFRSGEIQKEAEKDMDRSTFFEKLREMRSLGEILPVKKGEYKFNNPSSET